MFSINQGTNEDDSQSNPHPEAGLLTSGLEDRHDMSTGVQRESKDGCDNIYTNYQNKNLKNASRKILQKKHENQKLFIVCRQDNQKRAMYFYDAIVNASHCLVP